MHRARTAGERRTRSTVAELVTAWTALAPAEVGLRPTTADGYRYLLGRHVVPTLGKVRVESLTARQVADVLVGMDSGLSTRRSTYAALARLMDYAVGVGMVRVNVVREVKRPRSPQVGDRSVDAEGARRLLAAASGDRLGVAAFLGFGCGLRRGEVLGLRWSDVDLAAGVLHVSGNVTRSSAGLVRGVPKTRRGLRQVPVPDVVADALKAHRCRQAAEHLAAGTAWHDLGLVVTNEVGGMVEPRKLSRSWNAWAKVAKVKDRGTHLGRHYAASTLLASGAASVADVAAALGHDPAVLLNTYAVAVADGQRLAATALGSTLTIQDRAPTFAPIAAGQVRTATDD